MPQAARAREEGEALSMQLAQSKEGAQQLRTAAQQSDVDLRAAVQVHGVCVLRLQERQPGATETWQRMRVEPCTCRGRARTR